MTDRAPPNHRRRFLAGVLLATFLGLAVSHAMLRASLREVADSASRRQAVVSLSALAELSARAGGKGDPLRTAVSAWQQRTPSAKAARVVVLLQGVSLEASTAAADVGGAAAPRRLRRDERPLYNEKPLYDMAAQLRTDVQANREKGQKREKEIEPVTVPGPAEAIAAPLELDGSVAGMVVLESAGRPSEMGDSPWWPLGMFLGTGLVFALASAGVSRATRRLDGAGEKGARGLLALLAALATLGGLSLFGWYSFGELEKAGRQ